MKQMIDAIALYAPKNVYELAEAFDHVSQLDLGYRWLREFYFYDYRTKKNITEVFELKHIKKIYSESVKTFCISDIYQDLFFSPFLEASEKTIWDAGMRAYSAKILDEEVNKDMYDAHKQFDQELNEYQKTFFTIKEASIIRNKIVEELKIDLAKESLDSIDHLIDQVHALFKEAYGGQRTSDMAIWRHIQESATPKPFAYFVAYDENQAKIVQLRNTLTASDEVHHDKVWQWKKLKSEQAFHLQHLREELQLTKVIYENIAKLKKNVLKKAS